MNHGYTISVYGNFQGKTKNLGEVIGSNTDSEKAIPEILSKNPDIVMIDLLMPVKDGITVVKEVRNINAGIEFFIIKPNNVIEIENVIKSVIEKRKLRSMLDGIKSVIDIPEDKTSTTKNNTK